MRLTPKLAALLAALLLLASAPTPPLRAQSAVVSVNPLPPVSNPDGRFGIVQGIHAPDLAVRAGARWDRIIFPWSLIQKDGPDSWDQLYFTDEAIRAQAGRGMTMVGVMIYTPQWASVDPERARPVDRPRGLELPYNDPKNTWGQFVRKLAARHKGVVDHWVVWNEPDLFDLAIRYTWDGSYEEYFQLLKVAYLNIKEVNPQAKVIAGGFAYWYDKEYGRPPYLGPLFEIIGRDPDAKRNNHYFDIVSVHTYHAPLNAYAVPLIMREILQLRGVDKPIWISESNAVPYDDPQNPLPYALFGATLDQQASYVIQSMAMGLAAGVERHAIYKMIDEAPENAAEVFGIVRDDRSLKPAYVAYQVAASYFSNVRSAVYTWPEAGEKPSREQVKSILTSNDNRTQFIWPSQVSQVTLERGPNRTTVVWNNSPADVTYLVPATARRATLVTKYGKTDTVNARDGFYPVDLPGSRHNTDRRDFGIYMTGGDPFIVDEQVAPLPSDRVASRIEVVWPQGGAALKDADKANVTAQLLMPGSSGEPVPCRYNPETVQLWAKRNGGKEELVGTGVRRIADEGGVRYPVWDFEAVSVEHVRRDAARAEAEGNQPAANPPAGTPTPRPSPTPGAGSTGTPSSGPEQRDYIEFYAAVDGLRTEAATWTYGGPNAADWTKPRVRPSKSCE
jgi:hypothetical protein